MNLNEWAKVIHDNAVAHGFWDEPYNFGMIVALCHSELSEALEADRAGEPIVWLRRKCGVNDTECIYLKDGECDLQQYCEYQEKDKPEGAAVELIDCLIRILDWCARMGVDVEEVMQLKHEYNKTRPHKHGKKY